VGDLRCGSCIHVGATRFTDLPCARARLRSTRLLCPLWPRHSRAELQVAYEGRGRAGPAHRFRAHRPIAGVVP
jgi:hypothetical protein